MARSRRRDASGLVRDSIVYALTNLLETHSVVVVDGFLYYFMKENRMLAMRQVCATIRRTLDKTLRNRWSVVGGRSTDWLSRPK